MPPSVKNKKELVQQAAKSAKSKAGQKPVTSKAKCPKLEPCNPGFFGDTKIYKGKNGKNYTGKELNDASKVIYAEASGSQQIKDVAERQNEKNAMMAALENRRGQSGFNPKNSREVAKDFSEVIRQPTQFASVTGTEKDREKWSKVDKSESISPANCSDLKDSVNTVKDFINNGIPLNANGKPKYDYDSWTSEEYGKNRGIKGDTIGKSRFHKIKK